MKPRKVLHVTRVAEGGVAVVVDQLARGLDKDRYESIVLFETHVKSAIRKRLSKSGIKTIDLKKGLDDRTSNLPNSPKMYNTSGRIMANFGKEAREIYLSLKSFLEFLSKQAPRIRLLIRTFRENKVDLIHTHSSLYSGKPEIIAAWICGIPCVAHYHRYRKFNYFDGMFARFVAAFIYISGDVAKFYRTQKIEPTKGIIIHNGVDMSKFSQVYSTDSVRKDFGLESGQTLVGLIGRIDWWKGHEYFIEAMAMAVQKISGLRGLIIGPLEKNFSVNRNRLYLKKLRTLIESLNLKDKIIFTGLRDDVPRLISALDVVVHASSRPEPFGLVVIEAMAAGKPVVATAAGGVLDIIKDGLNGLLVPCRDAESMATAILQLISNPQRAKQIGNAARQCVTDKFTVQQQVRAVQKLYDDVLVDHQRRKKSRFKLCHES